MVSPDDIDFRAVAAQAPVAWSVLDLDGNQVVGNAAYADLFGYPVDEMGQLHVSDLTHPDDRSLTDEYLDRLVRGDIDRYETDKRYVRRDGSVFVGHLIASLLRDDDGRPQALVGVVTDVTHERELASKVALSEERLSKMLTNISETVTLLQGDGTVEATTGFHTEILGYPPDFWAGVSIFDLVHPDQRAEADALAAEVLSSPGAELVGEFRIRHHLGHYEEIELAVVNLLDDPAVRAVVVTSRNVSERNAQERELVRVRDRALQLAQQRAAFVADLTHELRTPLRSVLEMSELLAQSPLAGVDQDVVDSLTAEARRLNDTIDDLLDHARIEAGDLVLEQAAVNVRELVDGIVDRCSTTHHAEGLDVVVEIDPQVPEEIITDPHRLGQVLTNLLDNAMKFTAEGRVATEVTLVGERLRVSVSDTGTGIPVGFRDELFEPFTQAPGAASTVEGSGLGLALVRGLVGLLGGTVDFRTVDGEGTTFQIELPVEAATSGVVTDHSAPVDRSGISVLVVEDDPTHQMLVHQQLERLGHDCVIASDGGEALTRLGAADHGFDLVLMDWQMPDMDGLETTRRLRALEGDRTPVPVVGVTASALPEHRLACRAAGMDDFLPKPVSLADLSATIDRWVSRAGSAGRPGRAPLPFDPARLELLVDDLGERSAVETLVSSYLRELDGRETSVADAVRRADLDALHRVGHTLRSTSEMLGADELVGVCLRMEEATASTDLEPLMEHFTRAVGGVRSGLAGWLGGAGA